MEHLGYPTFILYLILVIGMPLAISKPYKAFLLIVLIFTSADTVKFTYTRITPYFNLNDACLIVALLAMISYARLTRKKIIIPNVIRLIMLALFIGFFQSWYILPEFHYEVLRALRWAISMPVYFIIAATMANSKEKARMLLIALFLGSIVSAFEHIFFVRSIINEATSDVRVDQLRTIAFRGSGLYFLISSFIWIPKIKGLSRNALVVGGSLFAVSTLLNQTRSVWISFIVTSSLIFMLFPQKRAIKRVAIILLLLPVIFSGMLVITHYVIPSIDIDNIVTQRLTTLTDEDSRFESTITRQYDFDRETAEWEKGTLVFGRGLAYFSPYYLDYYRGYRVAWGHFGHVTTLAQLGIIGLFVFSVYLPLKVIQAAKKLWLESSQELRFWGLLGGVCMVSCWTTFFMSGSFLGQVEVEGVIFGAVWAQARLLPEKKEKTDWISNQQVFIVGEQHADA